MIGLVDQYLRGAVFNGCNFDPNSFAFQMTDQFNIIRIPRQDDDRIHFIGTRPARTLGGTRAHPGGNSTAPCIQTLVYACPDAASSTSGSKARLIRTGGNLDLEAQTNSGSGHSSKLHEGGEAGLNAGAKAARAINTPYGPQTA